MKQIILNVTFVVLSGLSFAQTNDVTKETTVVKTEVDVIVVEPIEAIPLNELNNYSNNHEIVNESGGKESPKKIVVMQSTAISLESYDGSKHIKSIETSESNKQQNQQLIIIPAEAAKPLLQEEKLSEEEK